MRTHRVAAIALATMLLLGVGATATGAAVATAKAPLCKGKTKKKAIKAIKKAYDTVLNGSLPLTLDEKFEFIEGSDDPEFHQTLIDIANANSAMLETTSAQVNKVTCKGKDSVSGTKFGPKLADVDWDLVLNGAVAADLAPEGQAVLDGKVWKMSQKTVCDLFSLADPTLAESGPCADVLAG